MEPVPGTHSGGRVTSAAILARTSNGRGPGDPVSPRPPIRAPQRTPHCKHGVDAVLVRIDFSIRLFTIVKRVLYDNTGSRL